MICAAHICTSNGETSRPITKLYPLEISAKEQQLRGLSNVCWIQNQSHEAPEELRIEHMNIYLSELKYFARGVLRNLSNYNYSHCI